MQNKDIAQKVGNTIREKYKSGEIKKISGEQH